MALPGGAQAAVLDPAAPGACTIGWDGGARTASWHDRANWVGDRLPGSSDVACVSSTAAGGQVVWSTGTATVGALRTDAVLVVRAGELSLAGDSYTGGVALHGGRLSTGFHLQTGPLEQTAGTLAGAGALLVAGTFTWSGGTQEGPGTTTVGRGAGEDALLLTGEGVRTAAGRDVVVRAGLTWTGGGELALASGTTLQLQGVSDVLVPAAVTGAGRVLLDGRLEVTRPLAVAGAFDVTARGSVEVSSTAGVLELAGGGRLDGPVDAVEEATLRVRGGTVAARAAITVARLDVQAGVLDAAAGVVGVHTQVSGGRLALHGAFSSLGDLELSGEGVLEVATHTSTTTLDVTGGTLTGPDELYVREGATWTGGRLTGDGTLRVEGTLSLDGDLPLEDRLLLTGTLRPAGPTTLTTSGGAQVVSDLVQVDGQALTVVGTSELGADATAVTAGGALRLEVPFWSDGREATVVVEGPTSVLSALAGGRHAGRVDVRDGSLVLGGTTELESTSVVTASGGARTEVPEGAVLTVLGRAGFGALRVGGRVVVDGPLATQATRVDNAGGEVLVTNGAQLVATDGPYVQTGEALTELAGPLSLLAAETGGVDLRGGVLRGTGHVDADVRNAASVELPGTLTVRGSYAQTAEGHLDVHLAWGARGKLVVEQDAQLAGAVGTTVLAGARLLGPYTFLETASRTGEFDAHRCSALEHLPTSVRLVPGACADVSEAEVVEGMGALRFTVSLSQPVSRPVVVAYRRTGGTATPGADVTDTDGTVTVPAGAWEAVFEVPVVDDDDEEPTETVELALTSSTDELGASTTTGRVLDGDERAETTTLRLTPHRIPTTFLAAPAATNDRLVVGGESPDADTGYGWAFRLSDDLFQHVPGMSGVEDVTANDLIVGYCDDFGACTRKDRVSSGLDRPDHSSAHPEDANDAGTIVGSWTDGSTTKHVTRAARWVRPDAPLETLPVPQDSSAIAVNAGGTVVGRTVSEAGSRSWVLSPAGTVSGRRPSRAPTTRPCGASTTADGSTASRPASAPTSGGHGAGPLPAGSSTSVRAS